MARARRLHEHLAEKLAWSDVDRQILPEYSQMLIISLKNIIADLTVEPDVIILLLYRIKQERPDVHKAMMADEDFINLIGTRLLQERPQDVNRIMSEIIKR